MAVNIAPNNRIKYVSSTIGASGDTQLVAAPGSGRQIVISYFSLQNATGVATTAILKAGATAIFTYLGQNQQNAIWLQQSSEREIEIGDNVALNLNLSGANSNIINVGYYIDNLLP